MKYHELKTSNSRSSRRVGRGIAAGRGKTAGRGTKGQKSRTGSSSRPGVVGSRGSLMRKLPKLPGFRSHRAPVETIYTGQLEQFANKTVTAETLAEAGLISSAYVHVKLLVKGDVTKKVTVKLPFASASAIEAVQKAGGSYEPTARLGRPKTSDKKSKTDK